MSAPPQPTDIGGCLPAAKSTGRDVVAPAKADDLDRPQPAAVAGLSDDNDFLQRMALRSLATTTTVRTPTEVSGRRESEEEEDDARCSTPVAPECRMPAATSCPPAPKKPRPASKGGHRHASDTSQGVAPLLVRLSAKEMDGLFRGWARRKVHPDQEAARPDAYAGSRKRKHGCEDEEEEQEQ